MSVEIHKEGPHHTCRNMYLWSILPPSSSIDERDLPLQRKAHWCWTALPNGPITAPLPLEQPQG